MTQDQLADRAGVSAATISRWENEHGNPPGWEHLARLSPLLGISMDELIDAIGVPLSPPPDDQLYLPLAGILHRMTRSQQKKLYEFLDETSTGSAR